MRYDEWKQDIINRLIEIGYGKNYSESKANSVKGYYYDTSRYTEPETMIKIIMQRCALRRLSEDQLESYRQIYKDNTIYCD